MTAARALVPRPVAPSPSSCESCGLQPATVRVVFEDADAFDVCRDCAPAPVFRTAPGPLAPAVADEPQQPTPVVDRAEDAPPLDWSGELRVRVSRRELAWVVSAFAAVALATGLAWWLSGGDPVALVVVGTTTAVVVMAVDSWLTRPMRRWRAVPR